MNKVNTMMKFIYNWLLLVVNMYLMGQNKNKIQSTDNIKDLGIQWIITMSSMINVLNLFTERL